ncbi:MAG: ABC transporter permease [Gemmataceae bacterium]
MSLEVEVPPEPAAPPAAAPPPAPSAELPLTVIEPRPGWHLVDLNELWRFRELLGFLIWRDIKVKYKQTALGAAWAVLQPLASMFVFTLFLGNLAGNRDPHVPYALYVFSGMLLWTTFANALTAAGQSVVASQNLVTKVYFPRLLIPLGAIGAVAMDFLIGCGVLAVMMAYYRVAPGWDILIAPLLMLALAMTAAGLGILLSALTVAYRDFRHVIPFTVQLGMFATPSIFIRTATFGPRGQLALMLNPVHGVIVNFRAAVLNQPFDWPSLGNALWISLALLVFGCLYFRRVERQFADII